MNTYSGAELTTKINAFLEKKGMRDRGYEWRDSSDSTTVKEDERGTWVARIVSAFTSSNSAQAR